MSQKSAYITIIVRLVVIKSLMMILLLLIRKTMMMMLMMTMIKYQVLDVIYAFLSQYFLSFHSYNYD